MGTQKILFMFNHQTHNFTSKNLQIFCTFEMYLIYNYILNCLYLLGSWHSWSRQRVQTLALKPDPLIYDCIPNSLDCFSAWKTPQKLPGIQLARHVDLFHLVVTDNQRPETLSVPHALDPPIMHTTHFTQSAAPWPQGGSPTVWIPINLSFPHMEWSLFTSTLHLVPKPGRG
jgi:hypothetical protein